MIHPRAYPDADLKLLSLEAVIKSSSAFGDIYAIVKIRLRDIISRLRIAPQKKLAVVPQGISNSVSAT